VGRIKEKAVREVADDYLKRLRHYVRCDEVEVKDDRELARALPEEALLVALEVDGAAYDSTQFASRLERWGSQGKGVVAFIIGGAEGIPAGISRAAQERISLSRMTLPHRLARVVLYEQLYRGMTIQRGEPYAREG
jgi:23S rRNA (pseudouridine1915-N3)-methyltransferase